MYKVVHVARDKYVSASSWDEKTTIEYKIGEWVKPNFGKLFVFSELSSAVAFSLKRFSKTAIFKCEVKNPEIAEEMCYYSNEIRDYWRGFSVPTVKPPKNTVFVDEVKLTERVDIDV